MDTKRGVLFVVVGLFIALVLSSSSAQNQGATPEPAPTGELVIAPGFEELYFYEPDDDSLDGCGDYHNSISDVHEFYNDCSPPERGCAVRSVEGDGWGDDDDTVCGSIVPGLIITQEYQENLFCGNGGNNKYANPNYQGEQWGGVNSDYCPHLMNIGGDYDAKYLFACHDIKSNENSQYLCSDHHKWRKCSEIEKDNVAWVDDVFYTCAFNDGSEHYEWQKQTGIDIDHDGFTTDNGDCDDNPEDDQNTENCPELEEGSIDCQYPQHSSCAICINPGRPEVCGDGINNDCGGSNEPISQLEGKTSDNCNKFAAGCEQKSLNDLNTPQGMESGTPPADGSSDETNDNEEVNINEIQHFNTNGESFSWTATEDGGYCCGFSGVGEDLGKTVYSESGGGNRICLNTNKNLVGREGEIPNCDGEGDWCWATASSNKFNILTIKKPLEQPYDLVSNSQNWLACDENTAEGTQDLSLGLTEPSFREDANRFYCYQEGEHGSWADCVEGEPRPLADTDVNGVKTRLVGDGLFALPVKSSTTTSVAVDFDKLKNFYDDSSLDIVNYDTLEFYVKFTKDIIPPADVTLIIRGPPQAGKPLEYFHQKVLGYAIGNPVLEKDRWIHVQVPLPASGWYGVSSIELQSEPADNEIAVRNIYLSKAGKTQFCSGEKSDREGQSAWLDGLDFYGN